MNTEERFGLSLTRKQAESLQSLLITTIALVNTHKPVKVPCYGKDLFPPAIEWGEIANIEIQFAKLLGKE